MIKMNESAIRTGIMIAAINQAPVKLKFKNSDCFDTYFGKILEIAPDSFVIEYTDYQDTVNFSELDNLIN